MKVFVPGANGQVGSELVRQGRRIGLQMLAAGHEELDISRRDAVDNF